MSNGIRVGRTWDGLNGNEYSVERTCDNCFTVQKLMIVKGTKVPKIFDCTNCGCETDGIIFKEKP